MTNRTEQELEDGYYEDQSESGICLDCKDHCSFLVYIDADGDETGEETSNCCNSKVHRF